MTPLPETSKNPLSSLTAAQIQEALAALSPEKVKAIRAAASAAEIEENPKLRRLPNRDLQVTITIPYDQAEPFMATVDLAGLTGDAEFEYIQSVLLNGLNAFLLGGREEEEAPPPATTTIPVGTKA